MTPVCVTVDVEDWYDGMAEVGHVISGPSGGSSGLAELRALLADSPAPEPRLTLFVVGKYCAEVGADLSQLAAAGHELASHGPDHGLLPEDPDRLEDWLRRGREMVEDVVQQPVTGFRSPRFRIPQTMSLERYREILGRAGFRYVSDRHLLGSNSAVKELPVFRWKGVPLGGGSYQRLLPRAGLKPLLRGGPQPIVHYYHSYDFGVSLPSPWSTRSPAVLKQVIGRSRIPAVVTQILAASGSVSCMEVADGL